MINEIKDNIKLEINKIILLYKSKNFIAALNLCNKLIDLNLNIPFLFNLNGMINLNLENWKNALLAFKKSLEYDNKFTEAYNNLGITYSHLGDND